MKTKTKLVVNVSLLVLLIVLFRSYSNFSHKNPVQANNKENTSDKNPLSKANSKQASKPKDVTKRSGQPIMVRIAVFDDTQKKPVHAKAEIWFRGHGSWWLKPELKYGTTAKNLGTRPSGSQQTLIIYPESRSGRELKVPYMMTDQMNPKGSVRNTISVDISDTEVAVHGLPIKAATGKIEIKYKRKGWPLPTSVEEAEQKSKASEKKKKLAQRQSRPATSSARSISVLEQMTESLDFRIVKVEKSMKGGSLRPLRKPKYLLVWANAFLTEVSTNSISEKSIKDTLKKIVEKLRKMHSPDAINVYLFASEEHVENAMRIGSADWWPKGHNLAADNAENISKKETYVLQYSQVSIPLNLSTEKTLVRIPEKKRKQIFKEYVIAQDRAMKEAEAKYPILASNIPMSQLRDYDWKSAFAKNDELHKRLTKEYEAAVLKKYNLTKEDMDKISEEAFEENWPFPDLNPSSRR